MVLGLAACGGQSSSAGSTAGSSSSGSTASGSASSGSTASGGEPVTLKIWFHGSNVSPDASKKVLDELNVYLQDKINAKLDVIWGTWGDFDQAVVTALAGGDNVDMYFTCNWSADEYNRYARDGYWVKLDDLLPQYGADLLKTIPEGIWECAKTNGYDGMGIYAVPALKDTATQNCWDVNGTLLAAIGYDVDKVCSNGLDYYSAEFEEMLRKAKEYKASQGENDFYPLVIEPMVLERLVDYTSIVTGDLPGANVLSYYYDKDQPSKDIGSKIVNKFATPEFAKFAARTYELSQKGFISPSTQNVGTSNDYLTACQSSGSYLFATQSYAYGCEIDFSNARGIDVRMVPATAPYMDATSGQGAMMAISAVSKNPDKALAFLNLLNTDPYVMTTLNYGLEGYTYSKNSDGTISFIQENRSNYSPWRNGMGNVRILPPTSDEGISYWTDFSNYYNSAETLPYGAFIFDNSVVETAGAAVANVFAEYAFGLCSGATDPNTVLPTFLQKLDSAGINDIVNAANKQMTEFLS
jgi:putative aldouronate transport system substrate-binding protein